VDELTLRQVPVLVATDLTPEQIRAYRIADNRTNEETAWDLGVLKTELLDLKGSLDLALTGFDARELTFLQPIDRADEAPLVPKKPVTKLGDLYVLGHHRLVCGDATDAATVTKALGRLKPGLMITDAPYGVSYDAAWRDGVGGFSKAPVKQRGAVPNDQQADWREAWELFPGDVAYSWHASLKAIEAGAGLVAAGFDLRAQIIWRKQQALMSRGAYHWQHECCWYAVRKGKTAQWKGDRKQTTVWDVPNLNPTGNRSEERTGHSTQKPIELMRRPILNHTKPGDAVYDPFVGSGTTLIAAEVTERRCVALEIDPGYCDVVVARWEHFSGKKARRFSESA
jgi:DNA modification methylase